MYIYNLYGKRISLKEAGNVQKLKYDQYFHHRISSSRSTDDKHYRSSNTHMNSPWDYELQRYLIQGGRQSLTPLRLQNTKRSIQSAGSRLLKEYEIRESEYQEEEEVKVNSKLDYSSKKHSYSTNGNTLHGKDNNNNDMKSYSLRITFTDMIQKIEDNQGMGIHTFTDSNDTVNNKDDIHSSSSLSNSTSSSTVLSHSGLHTKASLPSSSSESIPTFTSSSSFNEILDHSNDDEIDMSSKFILHSMKKIQPIKLFKRIIIAGLLLRATLNLIRPIQELKDAKLRNKSAQTFVELQKNIEVKLNIDHLGFDKYAYKINREKYLTHDAVKILTLPMVVSVSRKNKQTGEPYEETVAFLKAGQSFGELALIYGGKRSATIICKTPVELLVMSNNEFNQIFMQNTLNHEADHITFLRTIQFIPKQVVNHLNGVDSTILLFTFFRRNVTICIDSNQSNWIYIVKTGQCRILKDVELKPKHLKSTIKTHRPGTDLQYYFESSCHNAKSKLNSQNSAKKLDNKNDKIFIELKILEPSSVFGLESIAFEPFGGTTSVSLVSDGAECVAINKTFFIEHCPTNFLNWLRSKVQPFPSVEELESKLNTYRQWKMYRHHIIQDMTSCTRSCNV
ncbi:putative similar to Protein C20orf152 homolog [Schistosoma mansoni]|uniref:putative similar to Protein C20orf152 homolog n=1 Tax=Schistosoma mansoni TaxID=6183 RepID=UPI00022DC7D8|nr:putative similar to Protein C20orf152 homolog [Schistosoma mansoni]|eukprot:XP_018649531.1 putative similar to Protein C20orf152 homolog [Schistosoma mansoni]